MHQLLSLNIVITSSLLLRPDQLEQSQMKAGQGQMDDESKHLTLRFPPQQTPLQSRDEVSQQYTVNMEANKQEVNHFVHTSRPEDNFFFIFTECNVNIYPC